MTTTAATAPAAWALETLSTKAQLPAVDNRYCTGEGPAGEGGATFIVTGIYVGCVHHWSTSAQGAAEFRHLGWIVGGAYGHQTVAYPVPQIHLHAAGTAIGGGGEVGVVGSTTILSLSPHCIVAVATISEVVVLEVSGGLHKSVAVELIVNYVVEVEEVLHRYGLIRGR